MAKLDWCKYFCWTKSCLFQNLTDKILMIWNVTTLQFMCYVTCLFIKHSSSVWICFLSGSTSVCLDKKAYWRSSNSTLANILCTKCNCVFATSPTSVVLFNNYWNRIDHHHTLPPNNDSKRMVNFCISWE